MNTDSAPTEPEDQTPGDRANPSALPTRQGKAYEDKTAGNPGIIASMLLLLIASYRLVLSPWLGQQCRFLPTCSCYADEAIRRHGAWHGAILTLMRLLRCHPWHAGGLDPVPTQCRATPVRATPVKPTPVKATPTREKS